MAFEYIGALLEEAVQSTASVEVRGRVEQVVGTIIRAVVPGVKVGELCILRNPWEDWTLRAEVVGFVKQVALLTPLGDLQGISPATEVIPTGEIHSVPVGEDLLGRVLNGLGDPIDGGPPLKPRTHYPVYADPPNPMLRKIIDKPISLGLRVLDGVLTCGEGQRMGIFAAAGGGKSTLLSSIIKGCSADVCVLALIGDGALSGGLAYEGLNNAGASGEPLIVILNDNGMSINPNVGAVDSHLSQIRSKPAYYHFKKWYRSLFGAHPMENRLYRFNHKVKTSLKKALWPGSTLFEDMGFTYLGPIDGHDLDRLVHVLEWARELRCPVVVHVKTVKGKGYSFAEQNPDKFHGVGPFDPETGLLKKNGGDDFSAVFGRTLAACAAEDGRVCAITAAMADGTGLTPFAKEFPERFFDVAIAEGHAVAMSAGLAKQGMIPVFAVYASFLQRGYDQLIHDVALQGLHVVLGVDRAGLVGADGETQDDAGAHHHRESGGGGAQA